MLSTHERLAARQGQSGTPRHEYLQQLVNEYARSPHWLRKEEIVANLANFAYDPINYATMQKLRVMELFVEIISNNSDDTRDGAQSQRRSESGCARGVRTGDRHPEENESVTRSKHLIQEFAMSGICNSIPDPSLQVSFIESHGCSALVQRVLLIQLDEMEDSSITPSAGRPLQPPSSDERRRLEIQPSTMNSALSALTTTYFLLDSPAFVAVTSGEVMGHMKILASHTNRRIANIAKAYLSRYEELIASVIASP